MELENHIQEKHDQNKDGKEQNVNNDKTTDTSEDIFECDLCDFKTTHNPGLMSHKTKMHKNAHPCD